MILTAIVLLVVNIVDKSYFANDIRTVDEVFVILYYTANIRLMFQSMYYWSNKATPLTPEE